MSEETVKIYNNVLKPLIAALNNQIGLLSHLRQEIEEKVQNKYILAKWIPIEEKKPPNNVYVLVALYDARPKVEMHFIQIANRMNDDWFSDHDGESILGKNRFVTHWMPLPDKPEKIK